MPLNSVFGTANDAGAFFPSSLTRATPSVALAFSDFASNGSGNCNGEVLQPANRARQTTMDNGWRKKAKLGLWQGCIQFPFKTLGVPVLREREADSLFSDALQTLAARQSGARRKTPQRPSALLATRAKMPPSSRTMPRSSQSTLISATPSTPTETRFDSASRSSSTVLPTTTFQPTCRQPSYQPQRTELPPEPTSGLQEWARRKDRHSEQRQVRQRWKRPEAEDSSEQRHEASLGLQMAGWKAMS